MGSAAQNYGPMARLLHWLSALLILGAIALGFAMTNAQPGSTQNKLYDLHRSFGALVLALTGARLLWRQFNPPPAIAIDLPAWQRRAALLAHRILYFILLALPLLGWAGTSAYRAPIYVFGLFELPPILPENREVSEVLLEMHEVLALVLCAVLLAHVLAALHHHFVRKDDTLRRMLRG